MIIALCIILWLLAGLIGSTAMFYSRWGSDFFVDDSVSFCQAAFRSLGGPLALYMLLLLYIFTFVASIADYISTHASCTKTLFRRK